MLAKLLPVPFLVILWFWPFLFSGLFSESYIVYAIPFLTAGILNLIFLNKTDILKNPVFLALGLFLTAILLSVAFSGSFNTSLSELYKYSCALIAFLTVSHAEPRIKKFILVLLTTSCFAVCFFALRWGLSIMPYTIILLERHHLTRLSAYEYLSRGRYFVPFLTPSALGSFIILLFPLGVSQLFTKNRKNGFFSTGIDPKNIILLSFVLIASAALFATQCLGALAGLFFSLVIYLVTKKGGHKRNFIVFLSIILFIFIFIFYSRASLHHILNSPAFSVTQRFVYWKQVMSRIMDHPFKGNGLGTFPMPMRCAPHNSFLQIWGETGLLGFLSFLFICGKTVIYKFQRPHLNENSLYNGLWIGNLAFLLHNLLDSNLFIFQISVVWWVVAALLLTPDFLSDPHEE